MGDKSSMPMQVRVQLSAMMFFQFMMLAVWFVPLAAYLDNSGIKGTGLEHHDDRFGSSVDGVRAAIPRTRIEIW